MGKVVSFLYHGEKSNKACKLEEPLSLAIPVRHKIATKIRAVFRAAYRSTIQNAIDYHDRTESTRLLGELMTIGMRLNRDDFHVEVKFLGKLGNVTCFVYLGGKAEGKEPVRIIVGGIREGRYRGALSPKSIRKAIKALVDMSKINGDYCARYHGKL